ncbi:PaaI family thioesterase [Sphingorhabdus arenilitoris]|uniref:PaaI family thioesterase n=1 Tax=Sphingorhabdus arenilitoris TaxID=1490041 RepID=A0ABV8RFQ2_9SPHN
MSDSHADSIFLHDPVADAPGWLHWDLHDDSRFNALLGRVQLQMAADGGPSLVRMMPERRHSNLQDNLHGGATLAFLDIALFAGCRGLDIDLGIGPVTLDVQCQFTGAGQAGHWLTAEVYLVRETYRMVFLRGQMVQDLPGQDRLVISNFTGLLKKGKSAG